MCSPLGEAKAGACDQVLYSARDEHLAWPCLSHHARACMHRDSANLIAQRMAFSGVETGPRAKAERRRNGANRARAADRPRRAVKRGEYSVASSVDLAPTMSVDRVTRSGQKRREQVVPAPVAEIRGCLRRSDEIDKEHRREHALRFGYVAHTGQEFLCLAEDVLVLVRPEQMILAGKLDEARAGNMFGEVAAATHVDEAITCTVKDQGRRLDRWKDRADVDLDIHAVERECGGWARTVTQERRPGTQETFVAAEARREDLRRERLAPVTSHALHPAFVGFARGRPGIVVGAQPACEAAVRDERPRALWKGGREERAEWSALRESEQRSPFGGGGIHDRPQVVHALLQGWQCV